MSQEIEGAG